MLFMASHFRQGRGAKLRQMRFPLARSATGRSGAVDGILSVNLLTDFIPAPRAPSSRSSLPEPAPR